MTTLKDVKAFSSFSVDDLAKAKVFYTDTLGLNVEESSRGVLQLHLTTGGDVMIYPKGEGHTPATFTVLHFPVANIEEEVDALTAKGVQFEQYHGKIETDEKGISHGAGATMAWFKDPAGNIIGLVEMR